MTKVWWLLWLIVVLQELEVVQLVHPSTHPNSKERRIPEDRHNGPTNQKHVVQQENHVARPKRVSPVKHVSPQRQRNHDKGKAPPHFQIGAPPSLRPTAMPRNKAANSRGGPGRRKQVEPPAEEPPSRRGSSRSGIQYHGKKARKTRQSPKGRTLRKTKPLSRKQHSKGFKMRVPLKGRIPAKGIPKGHKSHRSPHTHQSSPRVHQRHGPRVVMLKRRRNETVGAWRRRTRLYNLMLRRRWEAQRHHQPHHSGGYIRGGRVHLKRKRGESITAYQKRLQHLRNRISLGKKVPHRSDRPSLRPAVPDKKVNRSREKLSRVPVAVRIQVAPDHRLSFLPTSVRLRHKHRQMKKFIKHRTVQNQAARRHKQVHDARRELLKAYLLMRLFNLIHRYLKKKKTVAHQCHHRYVNLQVGISSPVFGGVALSVPKVYIKDVSITGFDDTMSRAELWGCANLPKHKKDLTHGEQEPCGPGSRILMWVWYNGQDPVHLPHNSAIMVGYRTEIHYLVARLIKFKHHHKPGEIGLGYKKVKITFNDCIKPPETLLSSFKFSASSRVSIQKFLASRAQPKIDIACRHKGTSFKIYGVVGKMGLYGRNVEVYRNNGTQVLITKFNGMNRIHVLPSPVNVVPNDVIQVRCSYYQKRKHTPTPAVTPFSGTKQENCQVYLLTEVPSKAEPVAPVCTALGHFTTPNDRQIQPTFVNNALSWTTDNKYLVVLLFCLTLVVIYFSCVFCCKSRDQPPEYNSPRYMRVRGEEIQNLMKEYGNDKYQ